MHVVDPGHVYSLSSLDGDHQQLLTFVKREGENYPGNVGSHPVTTMQDVLRCLIDRLDYVQNQAPCMENRHVRLHLLHSIELLERRAAKRHGRTLDADLEEIHTAPTCPKCGHVGCDSTCHGHIPKPPQVPSELPDDELRARILGHYSAIAKKVVQLADPGGYLCLILPAKNLGVFAVKGVLNRPTYKLIMAEARAALLETKTLRIYGELCTYMGPGIEFTKLSEI